MGRSKCSCGGTCYIIPKTAGHHHARRTVAWRHSPDPSPFSRGIPSAHNRRRQPDLHCDGTPVLHSRALRRQCGRHRPVADLRDRAGRCFGGGLRHIGCQCFRRLCGFRFGKSVVAFVDLAAARAMLATNRFRYRNGSGSHSTSDILAGIPIRRESDFDARCGCSRGGGVVYSVCGFTLWILAGRPRGAERHLFEAIKMTLKGISRNIYRVRTAHG